MGVAGPSPTLWLLTAGELSQKPATQPVQVPGASASRYALHLTLFSGHHEGLLPPLTQPRFGFAHPSSPLPSPPRSLARQPPHRAGGTAAAGASSPPGRPRRTPPPPCWKRARRRRDRTGSRECAARPLPPSLRRGSLLLSREARGAEPAAAENGERTQGRR